VSADISAADSNLAAVSDRQTDKLTDNRVSSDISAADSNLAAVSDRQTDRQKQTAKQTDNQPSER